MKDQRFAQLAGQLIKNSVCVKPGEKVLIEAFDIPTGVSRSSAHIIFPCSGRYIKLQRMTRCRRLGK